MKNGKKDEMSNWVTNGEKRDNFIKQFCRGKGEEPSLDLPITNDDLKRFTEMCETKTDFHWKGYQDIPIPSMYEYAWEHFIAIWQHCETDMMGNRVFTYRTISEYETCMKVDLGVRVKRVILKMKVWAMEEIGKLKKS